MRKFWLRALTAIALVIVFGGARPVPALAGRTDRGVRILRSTYAYLDSTSGDGFVTATGSLTFDGAGAVTGTMDLTNDDTNPTNICRDLTVTGTYTVDSDDTTGDIVLTLTGFTAGTPCFQSAALTITLDASMALAGGGRGNAQTIYLSETDPFTGNTFANDFDPFSAVAQRR